jgi:ubiquinone/menaquinone biosynthesis C-methylase UbiE
MEHILHKFGHGLGDSVMFTAVLRHLRQFKPNWKNDIVSLKGKHSVYRGLVGASYLDSQPNESKYHKVIHHEWSECGESWPDSPGTKTALCLRRKFDIVPRWDLLSYVIDVGEQARQRADVYVKSLPTRPFALLHYQGNTSKGQKDLHHSDIKLVCEWLLANNITPVILDWDRRSPIPDQRNVFNPGVFDPLWMNYGTGDAETLAALIERACVFLGIDSGPCKVAYTTKTPTISAWVGYHPYHYCDNAPNTIHLVPQNYGTMLRGNRDAAMSFFVKNYRHEIYRNGSLPDLVIQNIAKIMGLPMTNPKLTTTSFHIDYYEEHRRLGLDYLGHGDWQVFYGKWLVESLGLKGKTVLDVGCACGSIAAGLAKAGSFVSGCDVNEHMIQLGRERWLAEQLKVCDAVNLHYWRDNTFDFIHSAQVFEHFNPELVPFILKEINRVTKLGGVMFVSLDTIELYERQNRKVEDEDPTHTCVKSMSWWKERLAATGWVEAHDMAEAMRYHPDNYFQRYDWDWFIVRKKHEEKINAESSSAESSSPESSSVG